VIASGELKFGTQYAFRVVAVNDRGGTSTASPISNTVVPFSAPSAPRSLRVRTATTQRGAVTVDWQPAAENGRAITRYEVTAGRVKQDVAGANAVILTGLGDGATVNVSVRAVNAAGPGPAGTGTAQTVRQPTLDVTGTAADYRTITVNFTANDGGGNPATCTLAVAGAGSATGRCTQLSVGGLWPGNTYNYTLTVANAAGMQVSATGSVPTSQLLGTVLCTDRAYCGPGAPNGGIWVYRNPSQNGAAVDDAFAPNRYQATCKATGGESINAKPYGGKQSNQWVRIAFPTGQSNYIPFAWFRLDGGDDLGLLPGC